MNAGIEATVSVVLGRGPRRWARLGVFDCVFRVVIPDNLSAVVTDADAVSPGAIVIRGTAADWQAAAEEISHLLRSDALNFGKGGSTMKQVTKRWIPTATALRCVLAVLCLVLLIACGTDDPAEPDAASSPATDAAQGDPDGSASGLEQDLEEAENLAGEPAGPSADGGCPISPEELAQVSGTSWTQRGPSEGEVPWMDGVPATTCAFASEETGPDGDPVLVVRTDVIDGEHVATFREEFVSGCEDLGGTVVTSDRVDGALLCGGTDGMVLDGMLERGGSLVSVSLVEVGDQEDARRLSPEVEELLSLVR